MLEQVLQQNASKTEAKSKQSQRQIVASRLWGFGKTVSSFHHIVQFRNVRASETGW